MQLDNSKSSSLFSEAQRLIPGGVNSPVRSFNAVDGQPLFLGQGKGSRVWDVDCNEYIDYVGSWGPLILGHADSRVVAAVQKSVAKGTSFGAPTEGELELARLISEAVPSMEMLRLVNSGTEANMSAIRAARAYTNRNKVVKFIGCYHGHVDGLLVQAGSGAATLEVPNSAGVPLSYASETLLASYNDLVSVERLFHDYRGEIAAVIVEPVAGNMGVVLPTDEFLPGLRALTQEHDALLIFDEVITGFRIAYGGAQSLYQVKADLTCLGKIIGGGLPVGAYGGRRDVMQVVAPLGPMYQAGTLSGNPLATAAGIVTLKALRQEGIYEKLEAKAAALSKGLEDILSRSNLDLTINRIGSMLTLFFTRGPIATWQDAIQSDKRAYARFFHAMLQQGVYLAPSQFESAFVSLAHSDVDIEATLQAARAVLI
jgi:glutamate-1-semialdehyde 2,1-aminomutase